MSPAQLPDYYEILQVSPRADRETIERVFRHLARRYHPDNLETGDSDRFTELAEAYRVLADAEQRAKYDARYEAVREERWRMFGQRAVNDDIAADAWARLAMLSILYAARRNNSDEPGVGVVELERLLGLPEQVVQFHTWYLRENSWIQRLESGLFAISALGVDRLFELGGPAKTTTHLLPAARKTPKRTVAVGNTDEPT
jgi:curved DNA-binding protein CbpA